MSWSTYSAVKQVPLLIMLLISAFLAPPAVARERDSVSDWMRFAAEIRVDWFEREDSAARPDAVLALAMFEAANAIEHRYPSYLAVPPASAQLDEEAAIHAAAVEALSLLYPEKLPQIDAFDAQLASHPGEEETALGKGAARAAFRRGMERLDRPLAPFRTAAPAGVYVPTETVSAISDFDLALSPWVLATPDALRPGPPPALTSDRYRRDLDEVRRFGTRSHSARDVRQTATASFWFFIDINPVLREICADPASSPAGNARLYAMFYMATDDAWIASADAKNHYQFWRPITGIRQADRDGNPATSPDASWLPLLPTPPHPEYPCAHCVQAAAQAAVLAAELRDPERQFTLKSSTLHDAPARRITLADYVRETSLSRIYAGAHYRFSNEVGERMGKNVAAAVIARWSKQAF